MNPSRSHTTEEIARATRVPAGYLSKVLQALSRGKIVRSQRGLRGGFTLARDASDLTVLEIVSVVDPVQRIRECPLGLESHGVNLCPLHRRLDQALAMVERSFAESTIEELIVEPCESIPLCAFPRDAGPDRHS